MQEIHGKLLQIDFSQTATIWECQFEKWVNKEKHT